MDSIRIANAPCSWGVLEFEWAGGAPPYERVLDEMVATGYAATELGEWGFLPIDPVALRKALDQRGLSLAGAFVAVDLTKEGDQTAATDAAIRIAALVAAASHGSTPPIVLGDAAGAHPERMRVAGRVGRRDALDAAGWDAFVSHAEAIARRVRDETGVRTAFHHHCGTFVETPGEIDELMTRTDPALLGLCLDTGHAVFGGGDPVAILDGWSRRVWHVHLKDCDPDVVRRASGEAWDYEQAVRHGVFCELGRGSVDFRAVVTRLGQADYTGWLVVEQDTLPELGTPVESAARNRTYLRQLGL